MRKAISVCIVLLCLGYAGTVKVSADVVGYFTFDDITGNTFRDASGNGLVGTLGAPAGAGAPEVVPGPSGEESDLAIEIPQAEGMVVDDNTWLILDIFSPITLQTWVRSSGFTIPEENVGIIAYGGNTGGYQLMLTSDGNIAYNLPGVNVYDSGVPFPFDGEWHHLAVVHDYENASVTIYLDGESIYTASDVFSEPGNAGQYILYVGRLGSTPNFVAFEGAFDRVWVMNEALTAEELDSDPSAVKPITDDTIAFFDFDEGELPYPGEGAFEALEMITLQDFTTGNAGMPQVVDDSPSGAEGDTSLYFENNAFAVVNDPNRILDVGAGDDYTLEAWVKYDDGNFTGRMVIFYYGPGGYSFSLAGTNPRLVFITTLRIADFSSANARVTPGEWHHIAVVHREGESMTFFVDGEEIEVDPYTSGTNSTEQPRLTIGSEPNATLPYTGWIDRIRISNEALTAEQLDSDPAQPTSLRDWVLY
ncbi:MAG: LamG domain-containing protein [bacterium]|jgi:archaellum component FlaG (FlaF/FlaG flagellin family)